MKFQMAGGGLVDCAVEQHGRIGLDIGNIPIGPAAASHTKIKQFFLCGFFSLQWIVFILAARYGCQSILVSL
ncbi:hypothetical protein [Neisseria musculi]|uniref:hypothetical protein n=1 Tax=Neisseria musculi TaxID=1815583 RepID=UPI00164C8AE5|nr:hypothetical protein [Neisseria musculi]